MRILAVSDRVVPVLAGAHPRQRVGEVELILSCGDLPYSYMEHLLETLGAPCFFVHGNHDQREYTSSGRVLDRPRGWTNLDGRTVAAQGLLLGGLEGSMRYRPGARYQYTEAEMTFKVWRMLPALLWNRVVHGRYLDILVTHSPAFGIHDGLDLPHRGFQVLRWFMDRFRPRFLLHGHQHLYKSEPYRTRYEETEVINVYPYQLVEW